MIYVVYFILVCVALFFVFKVLNKFKVPKIGSLVPVNGGIKKGKSTLSCGLTRATYKRSKRSIKIKNFFRRLFKKEEQLLPVVYSNVPLNMDYVPVTRSLLLREQKPIEGSVVYLQEASLVADSQLIKDKDINNELLLFFKLCGHQGVTVILDTQSISDLHYAIKRSMSQVFYVQHTIKWIPFFLVLEVIEYMYSDDGSTIFAQTKDTDELVKRVILPKSVWKLFDSRCYSVLTDDKPYVPTNIVKKGSLKDLKARSIISFRPEFNIEKKEIDVNEKKDN